MGETTLTYGYKLFELTGEGLKAKTAGEIMEVIEKVSWGVMQGCESVRECVVALATALTRNVIPPSGKVFLEGKKKERMEDLRDAWETWMAGRLKGNFYKPIGSTGGRSVGEYRKTSYGDDFGTKGCGTTHIREQKGEGRERKRGDRMRSREDRETVELCLCLCII